MLRVELTLVHVSAVSSEEYDLSPDGAPAVGRVRIDNLAPAGKARSPAPGRGVSAPSLAPAPEPTLAAMEASVPALGSAQLAPSTAAMMSKDAPGSALAPAATAAGAAGMLPALGQGSLMLTPKTSEVAPSLAPSAAASSLPAPAPAMAALAQSVAPAAAPVSAVSGPDAIVTAPSSSPKTSQDVSSQAPAPATAMAAAPAPSMSALEKALSSSAEVDPMAAATLSSLGLLRLQATKRIQKLPHGIAGSAVPGFAAPSGVQACTVSVKDLDMHPSHPSCTMCQHGWPWCHMCGY